MINFIKDFLRILFAQMSVFFGKLFLNKKSDLLKIRVLNIAS